MAQEKKGQFGEFIIRSGKSLAVHLVFVALLFVLGWWATSGYESSSEELKAQFQTSPDPVVAVVSVLAGLRLKLWGWFAVAMLISWLASAIFIGLAQHDEPRNDNDNAGRMALWIVLLLVTLGASALAWWRQVSLADVGGMLASTGYSLSVALGFIFALLAYWAATGIAVKLTMRLSVPFSRILPKFWN